ncbi:MAG: YggS family pyridoxal phosphate-dependent enzyme [Verrucomicrobiota bacterium]|nr:YggS family pyridoxal phosphate-dependent enzyme [Verrucomicrobiota bacterium]
MITENQFQENLSNVLQEVEAACEEAGRDKTEVVLLPVTKNWPIEAIKYCLNAGLIRVGENRVQESISKMDALEESSILWELIGHLQSNKVNQVVGRFERIQSVDSMKLVRKINQASISANLKTRILLQVNVAEDSDKFGLRIDECNEFIEEVQNCEGIQLDGLMTIASYCPDDLEVAKRSFIKLRNLRVDLQNRFGIPLNELSMGMSGDMREAILSGSTMIRVGSSLFGSRSA